MGYIKHDALIALIEDDAAADFFKAFRVNRWRGETDITSHLIGPIPGTNGYHAIALLPDGSKEGWGPSNDYDLVRAELILWVEKHNGEWIHVEFGGDDDPDDVVDSSARMRERMENPR